MGLKSKENGELLALAAKGFDVFVTTDRNLSFQQNVRSFGIAVVVMTAHTNRLTDLRPIVPALLKVLSFLKKGEVREIGVYHGDGAANRCALVSSYERVTARAARG